MKGQGKYETAGEHDCRLQTRARGGKSAPTLLVKFCCWCYSLSTFLNCIKLALTIL